MPKFKTKTQEQTVLFEPEPIGKIMDVDKNLDFSLRYKHPNGTLFQGDSIEWLKSIDSESIDLIFADPPYNIKKADWDKFETQEEYINWSMLWIREASRVLKKKWHFICLRIF